jgi:hypothetical protein
MPEMAGVEWRSVEIRVYIVTDSDELLRGAALGDEQRVSSRGYRVLQCYTA